MTKRASTVLQDPLDRALTYREQGLDRKSLDDLGFLPSNRGALGLSGHHVHEVSWSCLRGVKLIRYKQVDVVRVPPAQLESWREKNKQKCESDMLMPKFSQTMRYACLSKTHFTHANKLARDGNRSIFNEGKIHIKYDVDNVEGNMILEDGVLCCVYRSELLDDPEALQAIMDADNDDADIEMGEDEIQAQGRVESALKQCLAQERESQSLSVGEVFEVMKRAGLRAFTEDDTKALIQFRLSLSAGVAHCFRSCVFHFISGRVRVLPHDYKLVSTLEPRTMWLKASIIIRQYVATLAEKFPPGVLRTQSMYTGRGAVVTAKRLSSSVIKELCQDVQFQLLLEGSMTKLIRHYVVKNAFSDKVMDARTKLFSNFGRLALKVGNALVQAAVKASLMKKPLSTEGKKSIIDDNCKGQLAEIEFKYRDALVEAGAFDEPLPDHIWHREKKAPAAVPSDPATPACIDPTMVSSLESECVFAQRVLVTEAMVMQRLKVLQYPSPVRLRDLTCITDTEAGASSSQQGRKAAGEDITAEATSGLYNAVLNELTKDENAQSGWIAKISFAGENYSVDSDVLLPPEKHVKEPVTEQITRLEPFDWDSMQGAVMRNIAKYALDQVFFMTFDVQKGVVIEHVGHPNTLPSKLRVKTTREFKAGELLLAPYSLLDFPTCLVEKDDFLKLKKYKEADTTQMDAYCPPRAFIKVMSKDKSSDTGATFYITSPRFLTKEKLHKGTATVNMSPFWALNGTALLPKVNMALETVLFDETPMIAIGAKVPNPIKKPLWTVAVQCARNVRKISTGEYLHLSLMQDDDEEI